MEPDLSKTNSEMANQGRNQKCILIYEDDPEILMLCKMLLKKENFHIETLSKCEHVVEDVLRIKPNLILMDLWIPEVGGQKATTILKENASTKHIPILLFSANDKIHEICEIIKAEGYIAKPFDIHEFKEKIRSHIA